MEDIKKQILGFEDWDDSKKGRALAVLQGQNLGLFTGVPDGVLRSGIEKLIAGGCILLLCSDWI
jgi:hypothetical protein